MAGGRLTDSCTGNLSKRNLSAKMTPSSYSDITWFDYISFPIQTIQKIWWQIRCQY